MVGGPAPGSVRKGSNVAVVTGLHDVAAQRPILTLLVLRDLKLRYAGTVLGYVWTILEPLAMAGVYWLVFTVIMGARNLGEQPYLLFILVGMLPYNWFQSSVIAGCKSLTSEAKTVRSANMPRQVWVVRVVISKWLEFVLAIPVLVGFMLIYRKGVSWEIVFVPVAMIIQFALCYGMALIVAPLNVLMNDVQRVMRIVLRVGFYLTPVIYGLTDVSGRHADALKIAALNPLSGIICLYRVGFWSEQAPPLPMLASSVVVSSLVLALGLLVFKRLEGLVLKEI